MSVDPVARQYLSELGWSQVSAEALPGDASFRRYFRLHRPCDSKAALLVHAPSPAEDLAAFVAVDRHLASLGLRVPALLHCDVERGLALIEDLGDAKFTTCLDRSPSEEQTLYELALDVLIHLNRMPAALDIDLPEYNLRRLLDEAVLMADWFVPAYAQPIPSGARADYLTAWSRSLDCLDLRPTALVLRDFHVDNLMLMESESGLSQCALLDFQDAVLGHPAYDLASLLEDARRDVPDDLRERLYARFTETLHYSEEFAEAYEILAAQRHAKVLGIFVRLCRRDGKPAYLKHLPRVAGLLRRHIDCSALRPVAGWIEQYCPALLDRDFDPDPAAGSSSGTA